MASKDFGHVIDNGSRGPDPLVDFYLQLGRLSQRTGEQEQVERSLRNARLLSALYARSGCRAVPDAKREANV